MVSRFMKWVVLALALVLLAVLYHFIRYEYVAHSLFGTSFYVRHDRLTDERCIFRSSPELAYKMGLVEC